MQPERVVGVAGPLADLAALLSPGLPGIPGSLELRVEEAGDRSQVHTCPSHCVTETPHHRGASGSAVRHASCVTSASGLRLQRSHPALPQTPIGQIADLYARGGCRVARHRRAELAFWCRVAHDPAFNACTLP